MLREKLAIILAKHHDKQPQTLAAMIVGYLLESDILESSYIFDDPRYWNSEEQEYVPSVRGGLSAMHDDYAAIGIEMQELRGDYL